MITFYTKGKGYRSSLFPWVLSDSLPKVRSSLVSLGNLGNYDYGSFSEDSLINESLPVVGGVFSFL